MQLQGCHALHAHTSSWAVDSSRPPLGCGANSFLTVLCLLMITLEPCWMTQTMFLTVSWHFGEVFQQTWSGLRCEQLTTTENATNTGNQHSAIVGNFPDMWIPEIYFQVPEKRSIINFKRLNIRFFIIFIPAGALEGILLRITGLNSCSSLQRGGVVSFLYCSPMGAA